MKALFTFSVFVLLTLIASVVVGKEAGCISADWFAVLLGVIMALWTFETALLLTLGVMKFLDRRSPAPSIYEQWHVIEDTGSSEPVQLGNPVYGLLSEGK